MVNVLLLLAIVASGFPVPGLSSLAGTLSLLLGVLLATCSASIEGIAVLLADVQAGCRLPSDGMAVAPAQHRGPKFSAKHGGEVRYTKDVSVLACGMHYGFAGMGNELFYHKQTFLLFDDLEGIAPKLVSEMKGL